MSSNSFADEMAKLERLSDLGIKTPASVESTLPLPLDDHPEEVRIDGYEAIERFVLAGNATFTLVSKRTRSRFTYKVTLAKNNNVYWIKLLTGPDNETSYTYIGYIRRGVFLPKKMEGLGVDGFRWFWKHLQSKKSLDAVDFFHAGRCGRCGRKLTVPESIQSGFGPECVGMV
jgi:hypothetical protein